MTLEIKIAQRENRCTKQRGIALVESIVCLGLFAVIGLAFTNSLIVGYKMRQRMIHRSVALQIASDEMERQARLRANSLAAGTTTTNITRDRMQFQQVVTITAANSNGFDINVVVNDVSAQIGGSVQLQNTLVPYGSS